MYRIGIVGSGRIAKRFVPEVQMVSGVEIVAVYNPTADNAERFGQHFGIKSFANDYYEFLTEVDAVYIASPHLTHYQYAKDALREGKHVLCEIPFTLSGKQAKELYDYAEKRNLVLLEASKTAFCPAFCHLVTLVKSGVIGDVVDVKVSLSKMVGWESRELDASQGGGAMNEHAPLNLMAIIKLLGKGYEDVEFYTKIEAGVDTYTKANIKYPHATSSITMGIGVKTEGNMVVSGTKGYVYVPAPWWLMSYFEVRYEDQTNNRKYFYPYDGEGLRYESLSQ